MSEPFHVASTDEDLLPIVNERDEVIGNMPRRQVHLTCRLHRAVQICVFDESGRVWLQQRGRQKDSYPLYWDFGATGHVDPGESYETAARRELREELGIEAEPAFVAKAQASERTGWEFQAIYWLRWSGGFPDFNRDEVEQMRGFTLEEILHASKDPASPWKMTPCVEDHLPLILRQISPEQLSEPS